MKDSTNKKYGLLIYRLCETFFAQYQGKIIDKTLACEQIGIMNRTAYHDLSRLSHLLDEVPVGRYLGGHLLPHYTPAILPNLSVCCTGFHITTCKI